MNNDDINEIAKTDQVRELLVRILSMNPVLFKKCEGFVDNITEEAVTFAVMDTMLWNACDPEYTAKAIDVVKRHRLSESLREFLTTMIQERTTGESPTPSEDLGWNFSR